MSKRMWTLKFGLNGLTWQREIYSYAMHQLCSLLYLGGEQVAVVALVSSIKEAIGDW